MDKLIKEIKAFEGEVTFESLKEFIHSINIDEIEYEDYINSPESEGDYGRNILTLEPFECVLINWPPGVESAVHHHEGLFGYVWVIEGELDNHFYRKSDCKLEEFTIDKYSRNGLIPEPDGVIHKLRNNLKEQRAITIHFYYPAIQSFEGMKIFNLETGQLGVLSDSANTASWKLIDGHFRKVHDDYFSFVSFEKINRDKSHFISNVIPKPSAGRINEMNSAYFCEQATKYDFSDFNQPKRRSYIDAVDGLVAKSVKVQTDVKRHLDIATGTGRRALHIRELSGLKYEIVGADISDTMCEIANERGVKTVHHNWADEDPFPEDTFDIITFLYAFGHIPDEESRKRSIKKIASHLNKDGLFYFDVFSLLNKNEWGHKVAKEFEVKELGRFGYQKGDVFYRKKGFDEMAFLHYFTVSELEILLNSCGLAIDHLNFVGYAKNPGELVKSEEEGNIFVAARRI